MTRVRALREKRAAIHEQATALLDRKNLTAEDRNRFDSMMNEMDALKADIDRLERSAAADADLRQTTRPPLGPIGDDDAFAQSSTARRYQRSFDRYLRSGPQGLSGEDLAVLQAGQARDMGTGGGNALQGTGGGYFVPVGFVNRVEEALKYYGNMFGVSTIMDTATGQPLPYPTSNDTGVVGELVAENASVTTADVSLGNIVFNAYKFSTKMVKVSLELLQDSAFDISAFLANEFAKRLGRILNTKFTTGSGDSEPHGIITAATASGQIVIGDDNATSPSPTTEVGYLDLVNLEHSVDPLYRVGGKFMFADGTLRFLKTLKDKYGRPLWVPGVASNSSDTILGYGYSVNNDMASLAAGHATVAFGALDKYLIRRVKELAVLRLVERFADYGQVGFLGFARYDGDLLDAGTNPVKYLTQHS